MISLDRIYAINLMELTYQHKIHETTVNRINKVFENIFDTFLKVLEVILLKLLLLIEKIL